MSEVACERGAANVTTALVVARAGVSRRTFYEIFTDTKDCLLAALDDAIARFADHVIPEFEAGGSWRERIRASLIALLGFLDQEPIAGRVLIVESLGGGPEAIARRSLILNEILPVIDAGRMEKTNPQLTPIAAEGVIGGVFAVIHKRMLEHASEPFVELTNPLMAMIVLPYLGRAAANRELDRPHPLPSRSSGQNARANPLEGIPMRLTYRTVRVLQFIANNPRSTNSQIGRAVEIADQGQISKLLARLQRLGLTQNTESMPGKGKRNAWTLTEMGVKLEQAMSVNADGRVSR